MLKSGGIFYGIALIWHKQKYGSFLLFSETASVREKQAIKENVEKFTYATPK